LPGTVAAVTIRPGGEEGAEREVRTGGRREDGKVAKRVINITSTEALLGASLPSLTPSFPPSFNSLLHHNPRLLVLAEEKQAAWKSAGKLVLSSLASPGSGTNGSSNGSSNGASGSDNNGPSPSKIISLRALEVGEYKQERALETRLSISHHRPLPPSLPPSFPPSLFYPSGLAECPPPF